MKDSNLLSFASKLKASFPKIQFAKPELGIRIVEYPHSFMRHILKGYRALEMIKIGWK